MHLLRRAALLHGELEEEAAMVRCRSQVGDGDGEMLLETVGEVDDACFHINVLATRSSEPPRPLAAGGSSPTAPAIRQARS